MSSQNPSPIEVAFNRIVKLEYVSQKLIERIQQLEADNKLLSEKVEKLSIPPKRQEPPKEEAKAVKNKKIKDISPDVEICEPTFTNVSKPSQNVQPKSHSSSVKSMETETSKNQNKEKSNNFKVSSSQYKQQTPYRPPSANKTKVDVASLFNDDDDDEVIF